MLLVTIAADGSVSEVSVATSSGHTSLDKAALAAVKKYRFEPAEIDGKAAAVQVKYRYRFHIDKVVVKTPKQAKKTSVEADIPVGQLRGQLYEKGTRAPLPGLVVRLVGLDREGFTDARGQFLLKRSQQVLSLSKSRANPMRMCATKKACGPVRKPRLNIMWRSKT